MDLRLWWCRLMLRLGADWCYVFDRLEPSMVVLVVFLALADVSEVFAKSPHSWPQWFNSIYVFSVMVYWESYWLSWCLTTRQPLWVILCRLPEKKEKRDRIDSRGEGREGQRREMNKNESEETEEIKISPPPLPLPTTRVTGLAQL